MSALNFLLPLMSNSLSEHLRSSDGTLKLLSYVTSCTFQRLNKMDGRKIELLGKTLVSRI